MLLRAISQIFAIIVLAYGGASFGLDQPVKVAIIDTGVDLYHPSPSKQDFHDKWRSKRKKLRRRSFFL